MDVIVEVSKTQNTGTRYSYWLKAGLVFGITTGAFLVAKTTGVLSWVTGLFRSGNNIPMDGTVAVAEAIVSTSNALQMRFDVSDQLAEVPRISETVRSNLAIVSSKTLAANSVVVAGSVEVARSQSLETVEFRELKLPEGNETTDISKSRQTRSQTNPITGEEFRVTTDGSDIQTYPAITELIDGKFAIVWTRSYSTGYGQMYSSSGTVVGGVFNLGSLGSWPYASVSGLSSGQFVAAYYGYYIIFNADGSLFLSAPAPSISTKPTVTGLKNGKFVITWSRATSDYAVYSQMYNADGSQYGSELMVNTYDTLNQWYPSIAGLPDNKFVIAWESEGQDLSGAGIYGQMYNADGTPYGSEFRVNTYTTGDQKFPAITSLVDGKFVVAWQGPGQVGLDIYGQIYYGNGSTYGNEFRMNAYLNDDQASPSIAGLIDGKFIATWSSWEQDGSNDGVYGQLFDATGSPCGPEFEINSYTLDNQVSPAVTGLVDGTFVVTWMSYLQDGCTWGIYAKRFSIDFVLGSSSSDFIPIDSSGIDLTSGSWKHSHAGKSSDLLSDSSAVDVSRTKSSSDSMSGSSSAGAVQGKSSSDLLSGSGAVDSSDHNLPDERLSSNPKDLSNETNKTIGWIIGGVMIAAGVGVALIGIGFWRYRKNKKALLSMELGVLETNIISPVTLSLHPTISVGKELEPATEAESIEKVYENPGLQVGAGSRDEGRVEIAVSRLGYRKILYSELQLREELGQGSFGIVYKAIWKQEPVAVKRLHTLKLTEDSAIEFQNETETMARMDHPRIVHLFGICTPPDPYCLVMEYLPRGSLYAVLHSKQKYPWSVALQIGFDIGCGLALLHQASIVHRDLKSANVLLDDHFRAKIADFGLSQTRQEVSTISTKTVVGTPTWKAPETFGIHPEYSSASDVYAYGMILWEIVTRKDPYEGADANEIKAAVLQGEREKIPATCLPSYAELITRCWAQRVEDRPEAKVVAERLEVQIQEAQRTEIKPWYCDPSVKPQIETGEQYSLIEAPESDKQKVVSFYQHHAVNGMDIKSVKIIYNLEFNRAFAAKMVALQGRHNNPGFTPKWPQENDPEWRGEIMKSLEQMVSACQDTDFPNVKIIAMWHGTKPEVLDSVFRAGYASLAETDPGFYGQGIYSAYEADYAYRVYSKGALLVNWVAFYSAYPVMDGDIQKFVATTTTGKVIVSGHYQNYDAHFIPVRPANSSVHEINYLPCRPNEPVTYHELVVFEAAQCLPRYIVELQPNLPMAPAAPTFPAPAPPTTTPETASSVMGIAGNSQGMFGGKKKETKTHGASTPTPQ